MNTIIESREFTKKASRIWSESERDTFLYYITRNPLAGVVIPGTGGVRKIRWGRHGRGKRSGVRVVYLYSSAEVIWLLTIYAKNEIEDIPANELNSMREKLDD